MTGISFQRRASCQLLKYHAGVLLEPLTVGRRTIAHLLRTLGRLVPGHRTSYQRVLSHAHWSSLRLACLLTRFLLRHLLPTGPVPLVGDDTVDGHKGKHVYGKARHRDPVRSTHSYTAWRYGHKWVVLAVLVRFPLRAGPGPCRSWSLSIAAPKRTAVVTGRSGRPRNS